MLFSTQNVLNYYVKLLSWQVWLMEWSSLAELKHDNSHLFRDNRLLFKCLIILWREANKGFKLILLNQSVKRYKCRYLSQLDTAAVWMAASQLLSCHRNKKKYMCCMLAASNQIANVESSEHACSYPAYWQCPWLGRQNALFKSYSKRG